MRYLFDTNVFYHLADPKVKVDHNYLPLDWDNLLFISPLTASELLCSENTLEYRSNAAHEFTKILGVEILKPVNTVLAEHYGIKVKDVKENNLTHMLRGLLFILGKRMGNRNHLNELLKEVCIKHKEAGNITRNTIHEVKRNTLKYFGKNINRKLNKDEIRRMLKDINRYSMYNNIFIKRLKVFNKIDVSGCKELPHTLYPYANAQFMYVVNMLTQGTKPKETDWIDIEHFIYCDLYIEKILTSDTRWFKMIKQHPNFNQLSNYLEKPSFRKHEFLTQKEKR